jgi:hypothetical protein
MYKQWTFHIILFRCSDRGEGSLDVKKGVFVFVLIIFLPPSYICEDRQEVVGRTVHTLPWKPLPCNFLPSPNLFLSSISLHPTHLLFLLVLRSFFYFMDWTFVRCGSSYLTYPSLPWAAWTSPSGRSVWQHVSWKTTVIHSSDVVRPVVSIFANSVIEAIHI